MTYSTIAGTGGYLPERVMENKEFEKIVDTTDEWIRERSGIKRRHIAADGETTSDMAVAAARKAMEAAGVDTGDIDEAVRRAVRTTGMAVSFTATTIVGGIVLWSFSNLRFQAEMAQLLVILMIVNMFGAITIVPAFYSILRPTVATALLTDEQREVIRLQKERERKPGLRDADE